MNTANLSSVVTIAGTDPSGGAGIQADIKAISATGAYAASIITALVAQNTQGVFAIQDIPLDFVKQQCDAVFQDLTIKAVKVGMLAHAAMIQTVFSALKQYHAPFIVVDPVMVAKGGAPLLDLTTVDFLKQHITGTAYLLTPNVFEAEQLLGEPITSTIAMAAAAKTLGETLQLNVLVKGGHLSGTHAEDVLYCVKEKSVHWFTAPRIETRHTHGTGCTLSSAIASYLAQGFPLVAAIEKAKHYLSQAIQSGAHQSIGQGHGPVDHFYFLSDRQTTEASGNINHCSAA